MNKNTQKQIYLFIILKKKLSGAWPTVRFSYVIHKGDSEFGCIGSYFGG